MENPIQHQNRIIKAVLEQYNVSAGTTYSVTYSPDEKEHNARACDAYAEGQGTIPLAIEHTILQTFNLQKQHDAEFMKVVGDLETELQHSFPYRLSLAIPMFSIKKGQKWTEIKSAIKIWLLDNISAIPKGTSKFSISGVPFEVSLSRDDKLSPLFTVARRLDSAFNIPQQLTERIAAALADKDDQLSRYQAAGNQTLLILESQDIALVNRATIYQAFLAALAKFQPKHIDQVWLSETHQLEENFLCLMADQEFMDRVNPENAMFGPRYAEHWGQTSTA